MNNYKEQNDHVVLLTKETYEGEYSADIFENRNDADKVMRRLRQTNPISSEPIRCGFMTTSGVVYRVVSPDTAISPNGKVVWYVSHKCFVPGVYGQFDWINYFATKSEAKALFDERAEMYKSMVEGQPSITIKEDEEQLLILVEGKPVVYLDFLAAPVGEVVKIGALMLPLLLDAGNSARQ